MDETDVRVIAPDVGGAFGLKLGVYPEDILASLLAIDTRRPGEVDRGPHRVLPRRHPRARGRARRSRSRADRDGTLLALRDRYLIDLGAYHGPLGPPLLTNVILAGPYRLHDADIQRRVVLTNKMPMGAYRGYGQAESNYVREVLVDRLARRLGQDPADFRRRNLLRPEELPFKNVSGVIYDSGDYARGLDLALSRVGYEAFRARQKESRQQGRHVGVGMSCYVEFTGYPSSAFLGRRGARFGAYESVTAADGPRRARGHLHRRLDVRSGHRDDVRPDRRLATGARSGRRRHPSRRLARARRTASAASPAAR